MSHILWLRNMVLAYLACCYPLSSFLSTLFQTLSEEEKQTPKTYFIAIIQRLLVGWLKLNSLFPRSLQLQFRESLKNTAFNVSIREFIYSMKIKFVSKASLENFYFFL